MTSTAKSVGDIPSLNEKHTGVPERLSKEAVHAKASMMALRTLPQSHPRHGELPRLPPNTTREKFNQAITALTKELGSPKVEVNDKPLEDGWYMEHPNTHDAFHLLDAEEMVCSAMVYPASTSEVQSIVRWANKFLIPIYPISIGRNVGYGGASPRVPGSVLVDLGRNMNKILKIDAESATCMVEPGVTYFKLHEEIQKAGLPLWIDTPDLGGGSVLGNCVDRGVGYTPYGDHFARHCGMEVVLASGEVIRTGMGALPGKNGEDGPTWQAFQHPYGPTIDGLFTQSNFGIVTKMGFGLMPATDHQTYLFTFPRDEDFSQVVDIIRAMALKGLLGNTPQLRHAIQELAILGHPRKHWYKGTGPMPRSAISEGMKKSAVGDVGWVFYGCQYGNGIPDQLEIVKSEFNKVPGAKFYLPKDLPPDHYINDRAKVFHGTPVLKELDWLNWKQNSAHTFFSPITPTTAKDAMCIHNIINRAHAKWGFDNFPTLCITGREIHYISNIIYDRSSRDEKTRVWRLMREMIDEAAKEGFGEYRTHLLFADQVASTYDWNNGALRKFNEGLKDAIDPNGILSPGRNGIWPKSYRGQGWELVGEKAETATKARL